MLAWIGWIILAIIIYTAPTCTMNALVDGAKHIAAEVERIMTTPRHDNHRAEV
jgi:hypothetical protein